MELKSLNSDKAFWTSAPRTAITVVTCNSANWITKETRKTITYMCKTGRTETKIHRQNAQPTNAQFPLFRCRYAVPVFIHRCHCRCHMHWLVGVDDWLASYTTTATKKIDLDPIWTEKWLRQLSTIYGCNGTEFSYAIFTEQWNFTMAEWRNGNGRMATEWWKPCTTVSTYSTYCLKT